MVYRNTYHIIWYNITILWYGNIAILYCTQLTINLQYLMSACGGFLSSRKSVACGALQTFLPKRALPPHKNIPRGAAPIGLLMINELRNRILKASPHSRIRRQIGINEIDERNRCLLSYLMHLHHQTYLTM